MAKNEKVENNSAEGTEGTVVTKLRKLVAPEKLTLLGTIVSINERRAGDKFKHDTKIITVEELSTGEVHDVFITARQWKEYGCEAVIYRGNVVTFSLEDCKEGITGYFETEDSEELVPHEADFKSFARVVEASVLSILRECSKSGVDSATSQVIVSELNKTRSYARL